MTVNELAGRIDAIVSCTVEGARFDPPEAPSEGQCWIVAQPATGEWTGQSDKLALRLAGSWHFVAPPDGMIVFDKSRDAMRRFAGAWLAPQRPALPSGGSTVDAEARATLIAIVLALQTAGLIPQI